MWGDCADRLAPYVGRQKEARSYEVRAAEQRFRHKTKWVPVVLQEVKREGVAGPRKRRRTVSFLMNRPSLLPSHFMNTWTRPTGDSEARGCAKRRSDGSRVP